MLAALITEDKVRDRDQLFVGELVIQFQGFENRQPQITFDPEAIALGTTC